MRSSILSSQGLCLCSENWRRNILYYYVYSYNYKVKRTVFSMISATMTPDLGTVIHFRYIVNYVSSTWRRGDSHRPGVHVAVQLFADYSLHRFHLSSFTLWFKCPAEKCKILVFIGLWSWQRIANILTDEQTYKHTTNLRP